MFCLGKELEKPPISEARQNGNLELAEQPAGRDSGQGIDTRRVDTNSRRFHRHAKVNCFSYLNYISDRQLNLVFDFFIKGKCGR